MSLRSRVRADETRLISFTVHSARRSGSSRKRITPDRPYGFAVVLDLHLQFGVTLGVEGVELPGQARLGSSTCQGEAGGSPADLTTLPIIHDANALLNRLDIEVENVTNRFIRCNRVAEFFAGAALRACRSPRFQIMDYLICRARSRRSLTGADVWRPRRRVCLSLSQACAERSGGQTGLHFWLMSGSRWGSSLLAISGL
jgi:hypothetical protein